MDRIELPRERKVKHLTLIREPRTITPQEFNALSFAERLEMVRVSDSAFRYRLLIEAADGPDIMQRLSGQDVFLMLKEVGDEATESLLPMISPEQYTFCLDLDCWQGDSVDAGKALQWLDNLMNCDEEKILDVVREMNFELLVLVLKKHITILHGPEDIDDEDVRIEAMRRDGGYEISYRNEAEAKLFTTLFDLLFRLDPGFYSYLIEATRGESDALIEESVYQQRTDRLIEVGFPDPLEAKSVYGWFDPDSFDRSEKKRPMTPAGSGQAQPAFMLIEANPRDLLAAALAANYTSATNWELACLANRVLLADGVDLADRKAVQSSLARMYETFNLALEYLCDSREEAVDLLASAYFQHLFQLGHNLKVRLQRRAQQLKTSAIGRFLDTPFNAVLTALLHKPQPLYFAGLDAPGEVSERPFRSAIDLVKAEKWLDKIEAQRRLFVDRLPFDLPQGDSLDLAGCHPARLEELTLSQLLLTALANRVLGRTFAPEPLTVDDLARLHDNISQDGKLDRTWRDETVTWIETLVDGAESFAGWCLDALEQEFCAIASDELDPRFVGGLIVRIE